jgi:hypothetical protein
MSRSISVSMPIFKSKEEYEIYKRSLNNNGMECRYCNKNVESYDRPKISVTFNDMRGYEGQTLRVCACKGIDPFNTSGKRDWVVYNERGNVSDVNPYSETMLTKSADISEDGTYRYKLSRIWEPTKDKILFIMINPSTANANEDDRTIKALLEITKKWRGYGGFYVGNLYPHITPRPADLRCIAFPPDIRLKNEKSIEEMASECSIVIYAWGTKGPDEKQREPEWLRKIMDRDVCCIGLSVKGVPKHPNQRAPYKHLISEEPVLYRSNVEAV